MSSFPSPLTVLMAPTGLELREQPSASSFTLLSSVEATSASGELTGVSHRVADLTPLEDTPDQVLSLGRTDIRGRRRPSPVEDVRARRRPSLVEELSLLFVAWS